MEIDCSYSVFYAYCYKISTQKTENRLNKVFALKFQEGYSVQRQTQRAKPYNSQDAHAGLNSKPYNNDNSST